MISVKGENFELNAWQHVTWQFADEHVFHVPSFEWPLVGERQKRRDRNKRQVEHFHEKMNKIHLISCNQQFNRFSFCVFVDVSRSEFWGRRLQPAAAGAQRRHAGTLTSTRQHVVSTSSCCREPRQSSPVFSLTRYLSDLFRQTWGFTGQILHGYYHPHFFTKSLCFHFFKRKRVKTESFKSRKDDRQVKQDHGGKKIEQETAFTMSFLLGAWTIINWTMCSLIKHDVICLEVQQKNFFCAIDKDWSCSFFWHRWKFVMFCGLKQMVTIYKFVLS